MMRERPLKPLISTIEERRKLKPVTGEILLIGGKEYVATAVGAKYVKCYAVGEDPRWTAPFDVRHIVRTGRFAETQAPTR